MQQGEVKKNLDSLLLKRIPIFKSIMTFLRYLALGIASIGLSYSIYINLQQNKLSEIQTPTGIHNIMRRYMCTELVKRKEHLEELVADARPQTCWMGATLGNVTCDSDANVRHYQSHVEELAEFNQIYTDKCNHSGSL